jgi:hypothetical protein
MLHPTDPIRGRLLLAYEQYLTDDRRAIQQRLAEKRAARRRRTRPGALKSIVRLLSPA